MTDAGEVFREVRRAARVGLAAGLVWAASVAGVPAAEVESGFREADRKLLEHLPSPKRDELRAVLDHCTLAASGLPESFPGSPGFYQWLLDHPDEGVPMWRRAGAQCTDLTALGDGRFGWTDHQGSELVWDTLLRSPHLRLWYATGKVKPGVLMPTVPFQAVVVLRYTDRQDDATGHTYIFHRAEIYVHTDSRTANLLARMAGPATPRLAEQCMGQLELFFSGLTYYAAKHPEKIRPPVPAHH